MALYYNVQGIVQGSAKSGAREHFVRPANIFETVVMLIYDEKWRNNDRITEAKKRCYVPCWKESLIVCEDAFSVQIGGDNLFFFGDHHVHARYMVNVRRSRITWSWRRLLQDPEHWSQATYSWSMRPFLNKCDPQLASMIAMRPAGQNNCPPLV